jgi:hypothetical protein
MRRLAGVAFVLVVVGASCGWARPRFDAGNTGANPFENTISTSNVSQLTKQYTAQLPSGGVSQVATFGGLLYASQYAFDASGVRGCDTNLKTCQPLFTDSAGATSDVDGSVLFHGRSAYDPTGVAGCSGSPVLCDAIWTGDSASPVGAVDPSGLHFAVYGVGGHGSVDLTVAGYSRDGAVGCSGSPKVCMARWSALVYAGASGAHVGVAGPQDGSLFLSISGPAGGMLESRDATDATGPVRWTADLGTNGGFPAPVLSNGFVFANGTTATGQRVATYRADGSAGCSGAPKVCTPLWTTDETALGYPDAAVAVAGGRLFRATGTQLRVYDAAGVQGCSGVPKVCAPLWSATIGGTLSAPPGDPAVANGVVYTGADDGTVKAFDATGTIGCAGVPKVCTPLWTTKIVGPVGGLEVTYGRLFAPSANGSVSVFALPT